MTPLQQLVYSEMGISPLVLLEEPAKMGRDTVVAVTLPGEPLPPVVAEALEMETATADADAELVEETQTSKDVLDLSGVEIGDPQDSSDTEGAVDRTQEASSLESAFPQTDSEGDGETETDGEDSQLGVAQPVPTGVTPKKQSPAASRRKRSRSQS